MVPSRAAQFAGPHGGQREEAQGKARDRLRWVFLGSEDHLAQRPELRDRRLPAFAQWLQHHAELFGGIALGDTLGDRIDKSGRNSLPDTLGGFDCPSRLNVAKDAEHDRDVNGLIGSVPMFGKSLVQGCG